MDVRYYLVRGRALSHSIREYTLGIKCGKPSVGLDAVRQHSEIPADKVWAQGLGTTRESAVVLLDCLAASNAP